MSDTKSGDKFSLAAAGHFVEAILNEYRHVSPPRELTRVRVQASRTAQPIWYLKSAALIADKFRSGTWQDAFLWKESMRSHFELAELWLSDGAYAACAEELDIVLKLLKKHFSSGNKPMAEMHRVRAYCLRASGCELGACREESLAERMERGNRP